MLMYIMFISTFLKYIFSFYKGKSLFLVRKHPFWCIFSHIVDREEVWIFSFQLRYVEILFFFLNPLCLSFSSPSGSQCWTELHLLQYRKKKSQHDKLHAFRMCVCSSLHYYQSLPSHQGKKPQTRTGVSEYFCPLRIIDIIPLCF